MHPGQREDERELRGVEEGKTVVRLQCLRKESVFNKKKSKSFFYVNTIMNIDQKPKTCSVKGQGVTGSSFAGCKAPSQFSYVLDKDISYSTGLSEVCVCAS